MEYCAAGSLSDINEAIHRTLTEEELRATVAYSVLGLYHLHSNRSIHRVSDDNNFFTHKLIGHQGWKHSTCW
jgi:serine/threonine protein kinase